jgi:hypothetical protein
MHSITREKEVGERIKYGCIKGETLVSAQPLGCAAYTFPIVRIRGELYVCVQYVVYVYVLCIQLGHCQGREEVY